MLPVIFEISDSKIFWEPILIFLQPTIWSSSNLFKTMYYIPQLSTTALYHKQIFVKNTGRIVSLHLHHPLFIFISQLILAHPSKLKALFRGNCVFSTGTDMA